MASTSITYLANAHPATAYQAAGDSLTFPEEALSIGLAADYAENRLAFCDTLPAAVPSSMSVDLRIVEALAPYVHGKKLVAITVPGPEASSL